MSGRLIASDDDIPGVPVPASPFSDSLAYGSDDDDVFSVLLNAGQTLQASVSGGTGTDFDLYLYGSDQTTVVDNGKWLARANASTYPDAFSYAVTQTGTYYLDVYAYSGSGAYTVTYSIVASPPVTSVSGIPTNWTNAPVTVTFTATDTYGPGVAYTEYSLDGAAYAPVPGSGQITVSSSLVHTLSYRSADTDGNVETAHTATMLIDTGAPTVSGLAKVSVKKGKTATFSFKVADLTPAAHVVIQIYKGAKLKKSLPVGTVATNTTSKCYWKCTLSPGSYTWKVYATDLAGNTQATVRTAKLTVT